MSGAGDLNKRITIEAPTLTSDGMGGFSTVYSSIATVYAAIWPVSATDILRNNAPMMEVTHRIRIRYRSVMKSAWRISWAGRYFSIVSIIDPSMKHEWLDLLCKEAAG